MEFKYFPIETTTGQRQVLIITSPKCDQRSSIHFTILLDTSGSMDEENKLKNVKQSLNHLLKYLTEDDEISVIEFSSRANMILSRIPVTSTNRYMIQQKINQLSAGGGTNLSSSFAESLNTLYKSTDPKKPTKQGILLLTDGYINEGIINESDLTQMVRQLLGEEFEGTSLTCVGYGTNHNVDLLRILAAEGGAAYDVVQDLEDVARVFANTLGALISCSAQQVEVIFPSKNALKDFKTAFAIHDITRTNAVGEIIHETNLVLGDLVSQTESVFVLPPGLPPPRIKGCQIRPLSMFNEVCIPTNPEFIDKNTYALAFATYYRQEVAKLIDNIRRVMVTRGQTETLGELRQVLFDLADEMNQAEQTRPHDLYNVLQEEIREIMIAIEQLETSNTDLSPNENMRVAQETSQVLAQHSAFLSMGRGVRAHFTPATPVLRQITRAVSTTNPHLISTFSNSTQRIISNSIVEDFTNYPSQQQPQFPSQPQPQPPSQPFPDIAYLPPPPPIRRGISRQ